MGRWATASVAIFCNLFFFILSTWNLFVGGLEIRVLQRWMVYFSCPVEQISDKPINKNIIPTDGPLWCGCCAFSCRDSRTTCTHIILLNNSSEVMTYTILNLTIGFHSISFRSSVIWKHTIKYNVYVLYTYYVSIIIIIYV